MEYRTSRHQLRRIYAIPTLPGGRRRVYASTTQRPHNAAPGLAPRFFPRFERLVGRGGASAVARTYARGCGVIALHCAESVELQVPRRDGVPLMDPLASPLARRFGAAHAPVLGELCVCGEHWTHCRSPAWPSHGTVAPIAHERG